MMHARQESDPAIVAMRSANKGEQSPAEPLEPRAGSKRNPQSPGTDQTQSWEPVSPGAERIRQFVKENPKGKLTALLHHITPDTLRAAFHGLKANAAPGIDGMTWPMYDEQLEENLLDWTSPELIDT